MFAWSALLWTAVPLWADAPATSLAVYPPDVHLTGRQDLQRFIVVATRDDGVTLDVTSTASVTLQNAAVAQLEGNLLRPATDGTTSLDVAYAGLTASATVEVKDVATERPISFMTDVMPVFARAGCNTGSCHGAARGKDGFRLSLFGFDPRGDYHRLTREIGVRRINLAIPERSLLIEKATGSVPHTGGKLIDKDSPYCRTLMAWLDSRCTVGCGRAAGGGGRRSVSSPGGHRRREDSRSSSSPGPATATAPTGMSRRWSGSTPTTAIRPRSRRTGWSKPGRAARPL